MVGKFGMTKDECYISAHQFNLLINICQDLLNADVAVRTFSLIHAICNISIA